MDFLDQLMNIKALVRETYGTDPYNKPNEHCNWVDIGVSMPIWVWQENDAHYRERIFYELHNKSGR